MAPSYSFAIVRLAPDDARGERLNIGAVVFTPDALDLRVSKRLDKARALSAALSVEHLSDLLHTMVRLDEASRDSGASGLDARLSVLSRVGPLCLSNLGSFVARNISDYEARLDSIMKAMVDPEPAIIKVRTKRTHLLTQVKKVFRTHRVLAKKGEDISSHRIVPSVLLHEGLIADLVLKNGAMHVVETVDLSSESDSPTRVLSQVAVSGLVLESARMKFGEKKTNTQLVYNASSVSERVARYSLQAVEHQGAKLINWSSSNDRGKFIHSLSSLADPLPGKEARRARR